MPVSFTRYFENLQKALSELNVTRKGTWYQLGRGSSGEVVR